MGIDIPLIGYKHAYITTDKIPGIENMPNIRDHDASVYLKLQGDALHIGGYEHNPVLIEGVSNTISPKIVLFAIILRVKNLKISKYVGTVIG